MTEKTDLKKENQKNKKVKQDGKLNKNKLSKNNSKQQANFHGDAKKKNKGLKTQLTQANKNLKKKQENSERKSISWILFTLIIYISIGLGIIYIVDIEKFMRIKDYSSFCLNKTISYLPPSIVAQGQIAVEYVQPVAAVTINKLSVLLNETSVFFNTNPLVKDHWVNIREISSICGARLVDYMRTLYQQTTGYCLDFKNKFFVYL